MNVKVEDLVSKIVQTFNLHGEFGILYEGKSFENQLFTVTSTAYLERQGHHEIS